VIKEAFPNDVIPATGAMDYYLAIIGNITGWTNYNTIPASLQHLPIIPLHDFLAKDKLPKEDLSRIDLMDKRLKELEGLVKDNGNHEFIQWLTSINVANKIVKMFEGEMKQAPEIAERKETEPIPTFAVSIDETTIGHSYSVIIEQSNGELRKLKAQEIQHLIRWVLDYQDQVLKIKNQYYAKDRNTTGDSYYTKQFR
jgi:hypothetical protein